MMTRITRYVLFSSLVLCRAIVSAQSHLALSMRQALNGIMLGSRTLADQPSIPIPHVHAQHQGIYVNRIYVACFFWLEFLSYWGTIPYGGRNRLN